MNNDAFFRLISPEHLYFVAMIFGVGTIVIVAMIYSFLYVKKKRYRTKKLVETQLNEWISDALTEDELPPIVIPEDINRYFKQAPIRQFVTDSLINIKKNVTGSVADNLVKLYEALHLKEDSVSKLKSLVWHKRAKGIYELYMMHQKKELEDILEYTNSNNEFVRMEAQTAIVGFSGFSGLVFLDTLTYPMYEWQQIKLLEQLNAVNPDAMPHLPLWLKSGNDYVVHFALKLAEIYQQFQVHDNVVHCLKNENSKIRQQAIKTLGSIATENTVDILKQQYVTEIMANKKTILSQLIVNGTGGDVDFLNSQLDEEDDSLKLEAVRAIAAINETEFADLEHNSADNIVLTSIIKQVKYENAA